MFALPPRIKETSVLRSHYYIVDQVKQYESFIRLRDGKYLLKGFRGTSKNPICFKQIYKFLKCEFFLYLGFKLNNFKEWIDQIKKFYTEIDYKSPIIIANVPYDELCSRDFCIPLQVTIEEGYSYEEYEELSFIKHLDSLFDAEIHLLLNNALFAINKSYRASKFFNMIKKNQTFTDSLIKNTPHIIINKYKSNVIENSLLATLLPSLEDWICYEYLREILNIGPSKYGATINRKKYGMVDTSNFEK